MRRGIFFLFFELGVSWQTNKQPCFVCIFSGEALNVPKKRRDAFLYSRVASLTVGWRGAKSILTQEEGCAVSTPHGNERSFCVFLSCSARSQLPGGVVDALCRREAPYFEGFSRVGTDPAVGSQGESSRIMERRSFLLAADPRTTRVELLCLCAGSV